MSLEKNFCFIALVVFDLISWQYVQIKSNHENVNNSY